MNALANAAPPPAYRMSLAVLLRGYAHPTRDAEIRDPQGAVFSVSQYSPPSG